MKMKYLSKIIQRNLNLFLFKAKFIKIDRSLAQIIDQCKNILIKNKTYKA